MRMIDGQLLTGFLAKYDTIFCPECKSETKSHEPYKAWPLFSRASVKLNLFNAIRSINRNKPLISATTPLEVERRIPKQCQPKQSHSLTQAASKSAR